MSEEELRRQEVETFVKEGMANDLLSKSDLLFIIAKKNQALENFEEEIKKLSELFTRLLRSDLDMALDSIDDIKKIGSSPIE